MRDPTLADLRPRQQQIALLMAEGYTNKAMARQTGLAYTTIRNYTQDIVHLLDLAGWLEGDRNPRVMVARWVWEMEEGMRCDE